LQTNWNLTQKKKPY